MDISLFNLNKIIYFIREVTSYLHRLHYDFAAKKGISMDCVYSLRRMGLRIQIRRTEIRIL